MSPRIAIVGTGFIADSHARALAGSLPPPGIGVGSGIGQLVRVVDTNPAAAQAFSARWGVEPGTLDETLGDDAVDAVIICTPNDTHAELAIRVAAAGKHCLIEKPMALTLEDARSVADRFADAGLQLLVGHTHRHTDVARLIHECVRQETLGTVRNLRIAITGGWIWGGWQAWVLDPARSGGHAFHNGVHLYDLAHWWLGSPIECVYAVGQRLTSAALEIDDYLCATLVAQSGASAVCEISRGEQPRTSALFEVVVHGDEGTLVRRWTSDGLAVFTEAFAGARGVATSDPFARQLAHFADAIAGRVALDPSPEAAVHATAIAVAVEASARGGRAEAVSAR